MLDLRQLRYFLTIAEQGSVTAAAGVLNIAQPALSHHLRKMEAALGTPLLLRTPRGVVVTEAGALLVRHARSMLDQMARAEEEIRGQAQDPAGEVRLGLPGTISQIVTVPLIRSLRQRHPLIRLRIAEAMSGFVQGWLREGSVDLAILYGEARGRGLATRHLLDEDLQFFGPPALAGAAALPGAGAAINLDRALALPLILPASSHSLRQLVDDRALAAGLRLAPVIEIDSYHNIKALVCEGFGFSILPANAIADEVAAGQLLGWPAAAPGIHRTVHLAHAPDRPLSRAATAVQRLVQEVLHDLARSGRWIGVRIAQGATDEGAA